MRWATFWAIFSQTRLVTLPITKSSKTSQLPFLLSSFLSSTKKHSSLLLRGSVAGLPEGLFSNQKFQFG
jgi:hypothetical protein